MKESVMRTVLASATLVAAAFDAVAHEGHGQSGMHWHAGDLLALLAMGAAIGLWLWQRGRR
jgi:hypothetical protein